MKYMSQIKGQEKVINYLTRIVTTGNLHHAYLFQGPSGVGKYQTAVAFGKDIISIADVQADIFFQQNMHPDFKLINIQENRQKISIEQITADLEPWLAEKPLKNSRKIVVINQAHLLSDQAANALLKTLEEPPEYAVIILVADGVNIIETIVSRCAVVQFSLLTNKDIISVMEHRGLSPERAEEIAMMAQGSLRTAETLAEKQDLESEWQKARELILNMYQGDMLDMFAAADQVAEDADVFIHLFQLIIRDIAVYHDTEDIDLLINPANSSLVKNTNNIRSSDIYRVLAYIDLLKTYYNRKVNAQIIAINMCNAILKALHQC